MAYRNDPSFGRKHTDGQGNVTFIPYGERVGGSQAAAQLPSDYPANTGGVRDPFAGAPVGAGVAAEQGVEAGQIQPQQIPQPTRITRGNDPVGYYNQWLAGQGEGGDPLYNANLMGGNRVDRTDLQDSGLPRIIPNTKKELADANARWEEDNAMEMRNSNAAIDLIKNSRGGAGHAAAIPFLEANATINAKRGESAEGRLQYYLNKSREADAERLKQSAAGNSNGFTYQG